MALHRKHIHLQAEYPTSSSLERSQPTIFIVTFFRISDTWCKPRKGKSCGFEHREKWLLNFPCSLFPVKVEANSSFSTKNSLCYFWQEQGQGKQILSAPADTIQTTRFQKACFVPALAYKPLQCYHLPKPELHKKLLCKPAQPSKLQPRAGNQIRDITQGNHEYFRTNLGISDCPFLPLLLPVPSLP